MATVEDVVMDNTLVRYVLDRLRTPMLATSQKWVEDSKSGNVPAWGPGNISHLAKAVRMTKDEVDAWDAALGIRAKIEQEEAAGNLFLPVLVPGHRTYPRNFFNPYFDLSHIVPQDTIGTKAQIAGHYLLNNPLVIETMPYLRDSTEFWIRPSTNIYSSFRHRSITSGGGQMFFDIHLVESGKPVLTFDKLPMDSEAYLKPYKVAGAHLHAELIEDPPTYVDKMPQNDEKVIGIAAKISTQKGHRIVYFEDVETRIAFWQFARLMSYTPPSSSPKDIMNPKDRPFYT